MHRKCQMNNDKLQKSAGVLHPIPKLWCQVAGWDGPNRSNAWNPRGNKYIMTLTDYISKWAEAALLTALTELEWQSSSLSSTPEASRSPYPQESWCPYFKSAAWSRRMIACDKYSIPAAWATTTTSISQFNYVVINRATHYSYWGFWPLRGKNPQSRENRAIFNLGAPGPQLYMKLGSRSPVVPNLTWQRVHLLNSFSGLRFWLQWTHFPNGQKCELCHPQLCLLPFMYYNSG